MNYFSANLRKPSLSRSPETYWQINFLCLASFTILVIYSKKFLSVHNSIALFADDAKCSSIVRTPDDCLALQIDLNCLYDWTTLWGLKFNTGKFEVLRITRKRSRG